MSTAGFHITEDCAEVYLQNESRMDFCSSPNSSMIISGRNSACQHGAFLKRRTAVKKSAERRSMRW